MIFAYSTCMSFNYVTDNSRINAGSFFVEYGQFLAIFYAGPFTGAHFNWAFTLGHYIRRNSGIDSKKLVLYFFP
jgi:glycerol uptake facilitator-like aquaporin